MAQMASIMGNVMPYVTAAAQIANTVQTVSRVTNSLKDPYEEQRKEQRARQNLALKQLQDQQDTLTKQAEDNISLDKRKSSVNIEVKEKARRDALKRAVSRQRAKFGSRGISSNSGSSEAVLLGLFEDSEDEKKKGEQLNNLRFKAIDQNLDHKKSLNLLQTTQLKEKHDLERLYEN